MFRLHRLHGHVGDGLLEALYLYLRQGAPVRQLTDQSAVLQGMILRQELNHVVRVKHRPTQLVLRDSPHMMAQARRIRGS